MHLDLSEKHLADVNRIHKDPSEPSAQWMRGQLLRTINQPFADAVLAQLMGLSY
jgi:hypothetical protein